MGRTQDLPFKVLLTARTVRQATTTYPIHPLAKASGEMFVDLSRVEFASFYTLAQIRADRRAPGGVRGGASSWPCRCNARRNRNECISGLTPIFGCPS